MAGAFALELTIGGWSEAEGGLSEKCNRSGTVLAVPGMYRDLGLQESTIWVGERASVDMAPTGKWESGATSALDARCQAVPLYCIVDCCSLG